jgi:hypothetical protein
VEIEVVALQELQNLPQLTGIGQSKDENKQKGFSKMDRKSVKKMRNVKRRAKLRE